MNFTYVSKGIYRNRAWGVWLLRNPRDGKWMACIENGKPFVFHAARPRLCSRRIVGIRSRKEACQMPLEDFISRCERQRLLPLFPECEQELIMLTDRGGIELSEMPSVHASMFFPYSRKR